MPKTKATLYQQYIEEYFYRWKQHPQLADDLDKQEELHAYLSKLALKAIDKKLPLRKKFAHEVMSKSLFQLACDVGWLNWVYKDAETGEDVYAFFHLTFQEYFAACGIDDWHFFLKHDNNNPQPLPGNVYRIFEPQWREVILLWLGREKEELRSHKEELIRALAEFKDEWGGFYRCRAYFLAAAGLAEFSNFSDQSLADEILTQLVKWAFGISKREERYWQIRRNPFEEKAREVLEEADRNPTIQKLTQLLHNPLEWLYSQEQFARFLEENDTLQAAYDGKNLDSSKPGVEEALKSKLWRIIQLGYLSCQVAEFLGRIDPGNSEAIYTLIELLRSDLYEIKLEHFQYIRQQAAENLGKIAPENSLEAINALTDLLSFTQDGCTCWQAAESLAKISPSHSDAIKVWVKLVGISQEANIPRSQYLNLENLDSENSQTLKELRALLSTCQDEHIRWKVADCLREIDPSNLQAKNVLIDLLSTAHDEHIRWKVADSLWREQNSDNEIDIIINALIELVCTSQESELLEEVALLLEKIGAGKLEVIDALTQLLHTSQDGETCVLVAEVLGNITSDKTQTIKALTELMHSREEIVCVCAASSLLEIDPDNQKALKTIIELLCKSQDDRVRNSLVELFSPICAKNSKAINSLTGLLRTIQDDHTCLLATQCLMHTTCCYMRIAPKTEAVNALIKLLNSQEEESRCKAAEQLLDYIEKIELRKYRVIKAVINALIELRHTSKDKKIIYSAIELVRRIPQDYLSPQIVTGIKGFFKSSICEMDWESYENCYETIWYCAQSMPYPEFYRDCCAQPTLTDLENQATTPVGSNPLTQRLNLAEFPSLLSAAINSGSELRDNVQLICIDGSKFLNPDNPTTKIYNEMRRQGCPKSEDSKPKTMAQLQDYWDELNLESDKHLILVFYQITPLLREEIAEKVGFSKSFLNDLSKFDGNICVVTEQPDIPLNSFSPSQSNLAEDIVGWIRRVVLES